MSAHMQGMALVGGMFAVILYCLWVMVTEYFATPQSECIECGRPYDGTGMFCPPCSREMDRVIADLLAEHATEMERGL